MYILYLTLPVAESDYIFIMNNYIIVMSMKYLSTIKVIVVVLQLHTSVAILFQTTSYFIL